MHALGCVMHPMLRPQMRGAGFACILSNARPPWYRLPQAPKPSIRPVVVVRGRSMVTRATVVSMAPFWQQRLQGETALHHP